MDFEEKIDEEKRIALDAPTVSIAELPSGSGMPLDRELHRSLSRREVPPSVRMPAEFRTLSIHVEDKIDKLQSNSSEGAVPHGKGVVKGISYIYSIRFSIMIYAVNPYQLLPPRAHFPRLAQD